MIRLAPSRRYLKTVVITLVVASALFAMSAWAAAPSPEQQQPSASQTPPPAPAVIPPAATSPTGYNYGHGGVVRHNSDGYTETTRTKDMNGNVVKTTRDVDIDDDETKIKTTVKVGVDGPVSTTETEIKAK